MKHKVFFWLLLQNRLNTRALLRRKNMVLDSYTCELCLRQREETLRHLIILYPFAKNCSSRIGVVIPPRLRPDRATRHVKRSLGVHFAMEIICQSRRNAMLSLLIMKISRLIAAYLCLRKSSHWLSIERKRVPP
jgi:hypothetical protein